MFRSISMIITVLFLMGCATSGAVEKLSTSYEQHVAMADNNFVLIQKVINNMLEGQKALSEAGNKLEDALTEHIVAGMVDGGGEPADETLPEELDLEMGVDDAVE